MKETLFNHPVKNDLGTYEKFWKITTDQGYDCKTGYLLDYPYFEKRYKMIAIYLSKQQALDADTKAMHQITFNGNLEMNAKMFFFTKKVKKKYFRFFTKKYEIIAKLIWFSIIQI